MRAVRVFCGDVPAIKRESGTSEGTVPLNTYAKRSDCAAFLLLPCVPTCLGPVYYTQALRH